MDWTQYFDPALGGVPYQSDREYLDDCLSFLSMLLSAAEAALTAPPDRAVYPLGAALGKEALAAALADFAPGRRGRRLPEAARRGLLAADAHIKTRVSASAVILRLSKLLFLYRAGELERLAILLSLAAERHAAFAGHLALLQGDRARTRPTVSLCVGLYGLYGEVSAEEPARLRDGDSLLRREVFEESAHYDPPLFLRPALAAWLDGELRLPEGLSGVAAPLAPAGEDAPLLIREAAFFGLCEFVREKLRSPQRPGALARLCGREGAGRRFFLRHLVARRVCSVVSVSLSALCGLEEGRRSDALNALCLMSRLSSCVFALEDSVLEDKTRIARLAAERLLSVSPLAFQVCEPGGELQAPAESEVLALPFGLPSAPERLALWRALSARDALAPEAELPFFANTYKLLPGEISAVLREARAESALSRLTPPFAEKSTVIEKSTLVALASRRGTVRLSGLADRVNPAFGWNDLILEDEQKDILRLACSRLKLAHRVGAEWGFDKTMVYGRGVSVLLYGPPGTGKTMAAQIMAAETGMELYRIDLSRLSSKYVGETEKNISRLFEEARHLNIILFFDEADSLFSKRTEVTDANDRFANAETAFILQQVEQYEGMCILATNLYKNFDSAFIRRITCAVKFSPPDAQRRQMLWNSILPEAAPVSPDLDIPFLADSFEMSGSEIKSVLYTAAYLAAEKNEPISMAYVLKALRIDFAKSGRLLSESTLGPYA